MPKTTIPEPFASALLLQHFLESRRWPFCFIGGLVVARWGRVRATQDADVSIFTGFRDEEKIIDELINKFSPRNDDARNFALIHRVVLVKSPTNVGLDIALAGLPFEERAVSRSSLFSYFPGVELRTCSAEDLIVYKAFAGRGTDWDDIDSVVGRQNRSLNRDLIIDELTQLAELKGDEQCTPKLKAIFERYKP